MQLQALHDIVASDEFQVVHALCAAMVSCDQDVLVTHTHTTHTKRASDRSLVYLCHLPQDVFEAVQGMGHGTEFIRSVVRKEVAATTDPSCMFLAGGTASSLLQAFFRHHARYFLRYNPCPFRSRLQLNDSVYTTSGNCWSPPSTR